MRFSTKSLLLALSSQVLGAAELQLHEALAEVPEGWQASSKAVNAHTFRLTIALKQQNEDKMISKLYSVSTPGSPEYGHHLELEEINDLIRPSSEAHQAVTNWLQSEKIPYHSDGFFVDTQMSVAKANELFGAHYRYYTREGAVKLRTTSYSVPKHLSDHIDFLEPATYFGKVTAFRPTVPLAATATDKQDDLQKRGDEVTVPATCETSITPACYRALYSSNSYTPDASSGSRVGFGSFLNQTAQHKDLMLFEQHFNIPSQSFNTVSISGGTTSQAENISDITEANLDVQNIIGISHPLPVTQFSTGGSPPFIPNLDEPTAASNENEPYLRYYRHLTAMKKGDLPQVISNSYGDDEQTVPPKYAARVCNMIAQMGLRGITILESSGDTGVGGPCLSNDGKKTKQYTPQFPPSCPYLTAVGGTQSVNPEIAWLNGSGGFSNYFDRPYYQYKQVQTYLKDSVDTAKYGQYFNQNGRGFPDVSAHSLRPDFQIYYAGQLDPSGGTSAAAPLWCGIVGMLNDARLKAGKSTLGFLNPYLYTVGYKALNDITQGNSQGCTGVNAQSGTPYNGSGIIPGAEWKAAPGWDAVTGLGTPNFEALLKQVMAM